jgi:hypothetical protein
MTKAVMQAREHEPPLELARFALQDDGTVLSTYLDDEEREQFEDGIYVCTAAGELRPSDGRRFFDALDIAFASSTMIYVNVTLPKSS